MRFDVNCPHCGCPLIPASELLREPDRETIDRLTREVNELRATVARLRAERGIPLISPVPTPELGTESAAG